MTCRTRPPAHRRKVHVQTNKRRGRASSTGAAGKAPRQRRTRPRHFTGSSHSRLSSVQPPLEERQSSAGSSHSCLSSMQPPLEAHVVQAGSSHSCYSSLQPPLGARNDFLGSSRSCLTVRSLPWKSPQRQSRTWSRSRAASTSRTCPCARHGSSPSQNWRSPQRPAPASGAAEKARVSIGRGRGIQPETEASRSRSRAEPGLDAVQRHHVGLVHQLVAPAVRACNVSMSDSLSK